MLQLLAAVEKFCGFRISCLIMGTSKFWGVLRILMNSLRLISLGEHNTDFHPMVDFLEASHLRRNLKLRDEEGISSFPDAELFENLTLMGYNISPNQKFTFQKGQFSHQWKYLIHTIMQCLSPKSTGFNEFSSNIATALVCLATNRTYNFSKMIFDGLVKNVNNKVSKFLMYLRRTRIAQSSVPPTVADEPASPYRDVSQGEACPTDSGFIAYQDRETIDKSSTLPHDSAPRVTSPAADEGTQEVEINRLKERVKKLEERKGVAATDSRDDAPIKGRSIDDGEAATERVSDDTEEMATMLTSMDAATVLAIPTGSEEVPTASLVFATATVVTPVTRRKGKEVMVESETPKKQKVEEQIDAQIARKLEEQLIRKDQRRAEQIARDAEIARIHAEEELQKLPMERRIESISDLVKYQENYAKIYKFQSQQRKPWTKKQKRDYYIAVIRSNLGWKVEDFIPMGSKEEAEKIKRKGVNLEQESAKKPKSSEEVIEEAKSPKEVPKEKVKEMMHLVPIEEVYVESLQVKHTIIDWKRLVKETLSTRPPTSNKEMELWVELSRLYEPDEADQLWTQTQNLMHAPVEWKLYDSCGVHHVTYKDKEIFMLMEKDYPLKKGLDLVMICYKL
nr:synaptobrevin, longin-like domain protein [Tanacetum cinerariifolium]